MDSDKVGSLVVGEEFAVLATKEFKGKQRIQIDRGWVSALSKSGKVVLQQIEAGEEADVVLDLD